MNPSDQSEHLQAVVKAVADHFGVDADGIIDSAGGIHSSLPRARQVAMCLYRSACDLTYGEVAVTFGISSCSSVAYACEQTKEACDKDPELKALFETVLRSQTNSGADLVTAQSEYDFPRLVNLAAERMREIAYGRIKLWHGNNGYPERNLTSCLAWAWNHLHGSAALSAVEVPVLYKEKMIHVDTWMVESDVGIACEAKQLLQKGKWECIEEDIDRLSDETIRSLADLHTGRSTVPTRLYALLLADCWSANMRKWWDTKGAEGMEWDGSKLAPFTTGSVHVYEKSEGGAFGDYYWLYGWREVS